MRNKRKGILMACSILGSAAIVSTGFAAWVITSETKAEETGNIIVDDVQDDRLQFGKSFKDGIDTIHFGAPSADDKVSTANPWLTNNSSDTECLSVTLVLDLSYKNANGRDESGIDGTIKVTEFTCSGAIDPQYVKVPTLTNTTYTVTDGGAVEIPIVFEWGSKFGSTSTNPYNYYNDGTKTGETHGDDAYNTLKAIYAYNNYNFTVKVEFIWA